MAEWSCKCNACKTMFINEGEPTVCPNEACLSTNVTGFEE